MCWGFKVIHTRPCPQRCYLKYKSKNKSKLYPALTPRMIKNLIRTLKFLSSLLMSGPMRSVLEHLLLPPRNSCRVDTAFLSPNATGKLRDVETPPQWLLSPGLFHSDFPLVTLLKRPAFETGQGILGPLTSNSGYPARCWLWGAKVPGTPAPRAQHLVCWLHQSILVPTLD